MSNTFLQLRDYQYAFSSGLEGWLAQENTSLLLTMNGKNVFALGRKPNGQITLDDYDCEHAFALATANSQSVYLFTRYQIWRMENALPPGQLTDSGQDRLFVPKSAHTVGRLGIPDLALDGAGKVVFVNPAFNCLARVDERYNFAPLWQPPFMPTQERITKGDCCHLSGMAARDGQITHVTAYAQTAEPDGWKKAIHTSGVLLDTTGQTEPVRGLTMPHAPRWRNEELWLLNSGEGQFGRVDANRNTFEPVMDLAGFARSFCFVGENYAAIAVSIPPDGEEFANLPLRQSQAKFTCGIFIADLGMGKIVHSACFLGKNAREIFGVAALRGARRPALVPFNSDAIQHTVTVGEMQTL
jgi:uncharacterized protein (TIGR03032 family)